MPKRIYMGNLPFTVSEDYIRDLFDKFGTVDSVNLITDRETGRPRGFGFVEMEAAAAAQATEALNLKEIGGRRLNVNVTEPRFGSRETDKKLRPKTKQTGH